MIEKVIDWTWVEQEYQRIKFELETIEPLYKWSISPKGILKTTHKTKYGMADRQGNVHINQAFINTTSYELLEATIRHEFAHLCVGLQHGHDAVFKAKAQQFEAHFRSINKSQHQQISNNIGHKYELYASFKDGEELLLKKVQRKHKKYTQYKPTVFHYLTINGKKIVAFNYRDVVEKKF
ncbi:MAG: hypothetical protein R3E90_11820 [Marinicella sp.]|nr:hypothetical protein [Xanthomonadales bacterium]